MTVLDSIDRALLRELENNARQTNRELADALGVAPSTSLMRVRGLQQRGVIVRYRAEVSLHAVGRPVQALISVRVRPPSRRIFSEFREWAAHLPETIGLFVIAGAWDFLIHVAVADTDGLYTFVVDRLTQRAEVADVRTNVVYEHVRSAHIDPAGQDPAGAG
ncbi:Lrp/AsnC family transcriptional regulator [Actinopolymorpha pittospori]